MPIAVHCRKCGKVVQAPDAAGGKKIKCSGCGASLDVPRAARPARPPLAQIDDSTPPPAEAPSPGAPPHGDSGDLIAVPPIGVMTPTGLPQRPVGLSHKGLRIFARLTRAAGLILSAYCLLIGLAGMIFIVARRPADLAPAIAFFFIMLVPAAFLAIAGLAGRQAFLAILEMSERQRRVLDLLDELREK
jgi:hypothetical protein